MQNESPKSSILLSNTRSSAKKKLSQIERPKESATPEPAEVARHRIRIAMYRCRKMLHKTGMKGLAKHLQKHVPGSGTKWAYTGKVDWQL